MTAQTTTTNSKINGKHAPAKKPFSKSKKAVIAEAVALVTPRPSLAERFLLSPAGKSLSRPISQSEKEMAVSGALTGVACAIAGPVVGALAAVAATAADSESTKHNWMGVSAVGAGSIAAVGAGLSTVAGAAAATASTGLAMLLNRLRK